MRIFPSMFLNKSFSMIKSKPTVHPLKATEYSFTSINIDCQVVILQATMV